MAHWLDIRRAPFVTAVLWLKQSPWPVKLFATRAEAEAWLSERFAEAAR